MSTIDRHALRDNLNRLLGYDCYSQKSQLRADDLLVRTKASQSLGQAAGMLREAAAQYRAHRVPASTREHPFPPAEVMAPLKEADRVRQAIESAASLIRGLPAPNQDGVWERLRREADTLDLLMQFDWLMVTQADTVTSLVRQVTADTLAEVPWGAMEAALEQLLATARDRQRQLTIAT